MTRVRATSPRYQPPDGGLQRVRHGRNVKRGTGSADVGRVSTPLTILAQADATRPDDLRRLVAGYVERHARGGGSLLRLAVAEDASLDGVYAAVGDILAGLGRDTEDIADIEIAAGDVAALAAGGEHVVVDDPGLRERLLDLGCLPV